MSAAQEFSCKFGRITNDVRTLPILFPSFEVISDLLAVTPAHSNNFPAANVAMALDNLLAEAFHKFVGIAPHFWIFFPFLATWERLMLFPFRRFLE